MLVKDLVGQQVYIHYGSNTRHKVDLFHTMHVDWPKL